MYNISKEFIIRWSETEVGTVPSTVDTICPYCALPMAFVLSSWTEAKEVHTRYASARCVSCSKESSFFWAEENGGSEGEHSLFMHPTPRMMRGPVEGVEDSKHFDMALRRAYASALNMYNAREWTGTVVVVRRTLEDICKMLLPADAQKVHLSKQVEALRKSIDLADPIVTIADGLRRSGNLGPYFDLEKEPDRETATLVLDLLNNLIQYMFALPARVQKLHQAADALAPRTNGKAETVKEAAVGV
jgi:hypothetical protein